MKAVSGTPSVFTKKIQRLQASEGTCRQQMVGRPQNPAEGPPRVQLSSKLVKTRRVQ